MENDIQKEGMLKVGATLYNGKYRIERYLASGGFGNTYEAIETAFDEKVAIKELFIKGICGREEASDNITISLTENQQAFSAHQDKFRKEARRLRKLTEKHIVHVHDLFDENGTTYYVMDFIEGESLSKKMKRTGQPFSEKEILAFLPQILDALECVHNEHIWHLDLKPSNIMVDDKGFIRLIDFGASKQLHNSSGNSVATSSAMVYTPGYASSEQMEQNLSKFGPWSDLYSLGATLYNLLTQQQPPSPSDIEEDTNAALKFPEEVSKKTKRLIIWLMKPNRTQRPQNVAAVKEYLADNTSDETLIMKKKTVVTPPPPSAVKTEKAKTTEKTAKKPTINWALILAGIAIVFVIIWFAFGKSSSSDKQEKAVIANTETAEPLYRDTVDLTITVTTGPENMRTYKYTGKIGTKIGALPNGLGTAKFAAYKNIPAATYNGNFKNGICDDNAGTASMEFSTGDKFVGTFKNGYYLTGVYTLADGSYFSGSFQNGSPQNGNWYNSDGSFSAKVVNGVEK